jgi:uncharacterized protein
MLRRPPGGREFPPAKEQGRQMWFDPFYLVAVLLPGLLLAGGTALLVKLRFAKYEKVPSRNGLSGAEVAREILRRNGLNGVQVQPHEGFLSDHYDPTEHVVRLSPKVYHGRSIAAVAVAAHETGHALQHAKAYGPMALRTASVPMASLGSNLSYILLVIGFIMHAYNLALAGVILFGAVVFFQLITVPVEYNASSRAKAQLLELGLVTVPEERDVSKMLSAAALTYVAALVVSLLTLAYYLMRLGLLGGSRDD